MWYITYTSQNNIWNSVGCTHPLSFQWNNPRHWPRRHRARHLFRPVLDSLDRGHCGLHPTSLGWLWAGSPMGGTSMWRCLTRWDKGNWWMMLWWIYDGYMMDMWWIYHIYIYVYIYVYIYIYIEISYIWRYMWIKKVLEIFEQCSKPLLVSD